MNPLTDDEFDLLFKRAGIDTLKDFGGTSDDIFRSITNVILDIHGDKSFLYGNYIETHGNDPELMCLFEHFSDLKRKFVRAENYIRKRADGVNIDIEELLDTYLDLAVYGALGVQLILHLRRRQSKADKTC